MKFDKDPDATLDYQINWSAWLSGDTISASTWIPESGITVDSSSYTDTVATVWVSGGTAGKWYTLTNRITTAVGRTDDRTIYINVVQR